MVVLVMSDTLSRVVIDSNLPDGSAHNIAKGEDLDLFWEGIADSQEIVRIRLKSLANQRNPDKTDMLEDLEREYGFKNDDRLTDAERRARLKTKQTAGTNTATEDYLQKQLRDAGFDVYVYQNDPAVDPDIFLQGNFNLQLAASNAFTGRVDAFLGQVGGFLIVNGISGVTVTDYKSVAGPGGFCGRSDIFCGRFDGSRRDPVVYEVPTESGYWPTIFFVGGDATRDGTGAITEIEIAEIPAFRRPEFEEIILRYKPLKTWAAAIVVYV
jgi:hypothetical protein